MSDSHDSPTSTSSNSHESSPPQTPNSFVLETSTMPINRSTGRNVHIYDAKNPTIVLGGLVLSNGVTNRNLYWMLDIFIIWEAPKEGALDGEEPFLRDREGTKIEKNDDPLQPGEYYLVTTSGAIRLSDETCLPRMKYTKSGTRVQSFRDAVRSRDRRCVVSGKETEGTDFGDWTGLQAAHIFPLAREAFWIQHNYSRWITLRPKKGGSINSVQNGLLLTDTIHTLFDNYSFSINPDDNYKIVCFRFDLEKIGGRYLDRELLSSPRRPPDELLRWHFRQAVFANMKGAGEPIFEHDFPPGSDMVGEILRGPMPAERMEFELFGRLAAQVEIDYPEIAQAVCREGIST